MHWNNCRLRHVDATPISSLSDSNAKDLEEVAPHAKDKVDKSVQVGFLLDSTSNTTSSCEIPLLSSEVVAES